MTPKHAQRTRPSRSGCNPRVLWAGSLYCLGIMRTPRTKFIISALVLGTAVVTWALVDARSPVSLTVLSNTTNRWSDDLAAQFGSRTFVCALIAVTNSSSRSFTYWARGSASFTDYEVLREIPQGWKAPSGFRCGTGLMQHTLSPGQGFTFEAVIESDKRCRVEFTYSDGRTPSRIWQRLPSWLTHRLPWSSPWRTAITDPIDLRGPRT